MNRRSEILGFGRALLVSLAATAVTVTSFAAAEDAPADVAARIRATLHQRLPELKIDQIHRAPIPGLYEVLTGSEIVYSNDPGTLLVLGRIVDTKTREDLTDKRWSEMSAISFASLPLDQAIKSVKGDGSRKIAIFADPLCPYCRQLEQQMQSVKNVTVYTFLFPLESIHPGASEKATRIWCAKDRSAAWSDWMLKRVEPPAASATCKLTPVAGLQALGDKLHVDSTPTVFLVDGSRIRGAVGTEKLEQALATGTAGH